MGDGGLSVIAFNGNPIIIVPIQTPFIWNGTTMTALTNNWTASGYAPAWTASTPEAVGNIIHANSLVWKCTQAGTTGTVAPTWPASGSITDNSVVWTAIGSTTAGTPAAAFASVAGGCLFLWGTGGDYSNPYDGPNSFRQSDVGDPNSWNPVNSIFVGGKDWQDARGLAVLTIGAAGISASPRQVLFRFADTFEFLGLFPNATLTQAKTDMGCIAPGSIQVLADLGGVIRLTHRGFALYTGVEAGSDHLVSEEIRPYLFGGAGDITPVAIPLIGAGNPGSGAPFPAIPALSAVSLDPPLYLCALPLTGANGALTRVFILDLALMRQGRTPVWSVADLPFAITAMDTIPAFQANTAPGVLIAPISGANQTDGTVRRWMAGDPDWDGTAISSSFKTPQLFDPKKPQGVFYDRKVSIGGTGAGKVTGLSFDYNNPANGIEQTKTISLPSGGVSLPVSKAIDQLNRGGALTISTTGQVVIEAVDVEVVPRGERPYAQS